MLDSTSARPHSSFLLNPGLRTTASFDMDQSLQPQSTTPQNHPTKTKFTRRTPRSSFSDSHKTFTPSQHMIRKRSLSHSENDDENHRHDDDHHDSKTKKECCGCGGTKCADKKKKNQQQKDQDNEVKDPQDSRKAFIRSLEW